MLMKLPVIAVKNGKSSVIFPADGGGLGYSIPEGLMTQNLLLTPKTAVAEMGLKPVVKLAWNNETHTLVPVAFDDSGTIDAVLAVRIAKNIAKMTSDFNALKDFFPPAQIEQMAITAMMATSAITGITIDEATAMAPRVVGHKELLQAAEGLAVMGFTPNKAAIKGRNPLRNHVGDNLLMAAEDEEEAEV